MMRANQNMFLENGMEVVDYRKKYFPITIYPHHMKDRTTIYSHWHDELELTCIFYGGCEFYNHGVRSEVVNGGVNIVNSKEMHHAVPEFSFEYSDEETKGVTVQISREFIEELIPNYEEIYFEIDSLEVEDEIASIIREIYEFNKMGSVESGIEILKCCCDLLLVLYTKCSKNKQLIPINIQKDMERIRIIIMYMNEHYNEELKQQDLADKFYFSREYFSRFFRAQTGLTFKEYLMRYRLEKAKEELDQNQSSLLQIAINHGFSDLNHLNNWFKKTHSISPSQYRKMNMKETL